MENNILSVWYKRKSERGERLRRNDEALIAIEEIRETKSLWVPHKNYPNLRRNGV
jgi:hypothetical protein